MLPIKGASLCAAFDYRKPFLLPIYYHTVNTKPIQHLYIFSSLCHSSKAAFHVEAANGLLASDFHGILFRKFQEKEQMLKRLTITVDVLGDTERISSPDELDVKRYGVIVTKGGRRGLLLPNLEGVDTVEQQIAIAKQKAGISEQEKVALERFEVVRHY